jgi:hypothetical protein
MPLPATIARLLIGEEKAYAVSALKEDNGGKKQRK